MIGNEKEQESPEIQSNDETLKRNQTNLIKLNPMRPSE